MLKVDPKPKTLLLYFNVTNNLKVEIRNLKCNYVVGDWIQFYVK
jgi:hypothetical protein